MMVPGLAEEVMCLKRTGHFFFFLNQFGSLNIQVKGSEFYSGTQEVTSKDNYSPRELPGLLLA